MWKKGSRNLELARLHEDARNSSLQKKNAQYQLKRAVEGDNTKEVAEKAQKVLETSKSLGQKLTKPLELLSQNVSTANNQSAELCFKNRQVAELKKDLSSKKD